MSSAGTAFQRPPLKASHTKAFHGPKDEDQLFADLPLYHALAGSPDRCFGQTGIVNYWLNRHGREWETMTTINCLSTTHCISLA